MTLAWVRMVSDNMPLISAFHSAPDITALALTDGLIEKRRRLERSAILQSPFVRIVQALLVQILVRRLPEQPPGRYSLANVSRSRPHTLDQVQ